MNFRIDKNFWLATFSLVGATLGAGIFGLPYVFSQSGFWLGLLEFIVITVGVLTIQLMVGEISLRIKEKKRITGFGEEYLKKPWRLMLSLAVLLASVGTILAYIVLAGNFIFALFGFSAFGGGIVFAIFLFFAVSLKIKNFGKMELLLSVISIVLILSIFGFYISYAKMGNFSQSNLNNLFLPYGVILFSITGISVVPKMEEFFGSDKRRFKSAIIAGTLIPAIVYLVFIITVIGISGSSTSADAMSGLAKVLNSKFILALGSMIGLLTVSEAAVSLSVYFKETLWYDFKMNKWLAWVLSIALPLTLFLTGARNFIDIIGIVGAIFLGFEFLIILRMHLLSKKSGGFKPEYEIKLPILVYWILGAIIGLGAILEVWYNI